MNNGIELPSVSLQKSVTSGICRIFENIYEYFRDAEGLFLEQTASIDPDNLAGLVIHKEDMFLLTDGTIRRYNTKGEFIRTYDFPVCRFDTDTLRNQLIVLNSPAQEVAVYSYEGVLIHTSPIPGFTFTDLKYLGEDKVLLTTATIPQPETYLLDIAGGSLHPLQKCSKPTAYTPVLFHHEKNGWTKSASLFTFMPVEDGVWGKYLLSDTIYHYTSEGVTPVLKLNIGKGALQVDKKGKRNKKTGFYIHSFWENDSYRFFQFYNIANDLPYTGIALWNKKKNRMEDELCSFSIPHQIFYLTGSSRIFIDKEGSRVFDIRKYDPDNMKPFFLKEKIQLPDYLSGYEPTSNLLVTIYYL